MTEMWTCKGKGGYYTLVTKIHADGSGDLAIGAGMSKNDSPLVVYQDPLTRQMFYRTAEDFEQRMRRVLDCPDCEARQCMIDMAELGQTPG